jgi:asparagine synthase (glutamine-hydrolysing)
MKVVLSDPAVARRLDLRALNEYLSFEYVPTPRTILRGINRLAPGHWLRWHGGYAQVTQYWNPSLARSEDQPPVQWREFANGLRGVLQTTVNREMISDVPVGVLLSGGLDSSAIAACMVDAHAGPVDSFSVGFEEASFDESPYARAVARHLGTRHHELRLTSRMVADVVPRLADILDEPFGDASFVPTYLVSKFAREHVKVVLGGDGSDELFAGYPTLVAHRLIAYYERVTPWLIRTYGVQRLLRQLPVSFDYFSREFKIRRFMAGRGVPLEARHHRWMGSFFDEEKAELFQDPVKAVLGDTYETAYQHSRECDAHLPLNKILYNDMKMYLEGDILFKVDRASMAASLEVRVPFLNRRVVDFATNLPLALKLRRLTGKFLLKRAMAGRLPPEILNRKKQGFAMPVAHWLTAELKELTQDMLSPARLARQGLFRPEYVEGLVRDHLARTRDNRKLLWTLLTFQLWYAKYLEP